MHFAVAVVTNERPTDAMLAAALGPFGPAAGAGAKWDWWALGGRYTGALCRFSSRGPCPIQDTITNGVEFPDDELTSVPPPSLPTGGVDALPNRYAKEPCRTSTGHQLWTAVHRNRADLSSRYSRLDRLQQVVERAGVTIFR
jgi:hypothetical protein